MKRVILAIGVLLCIATPLVKAQKIKIGLLMDSYVTDRWYVDQKLFNDKIKELGGQCLVEMPYGNADEQVKLGQKLLTEGIKVLVIVPSDAKKAVAIVEAARQVNVPVISYDRLILSKDIAMYISYNNEKVGNLQAEYALKKAPEGNYLLINGPTTDNNAILFRNGQLNVLKPYLGSGKIKLIGDFVLEDWSEVVSMMKVDEFLNTSSDKPNVIIAGNDALATGAIQALPPELLGKVVVTGQDAELIAIKNIIAGDQSMTIYKPIKPLAYLAAETAMKLAKGQAVSGKIKFKNGDMEVDAILLDPVVVDKNNYKETVVKDGHVSLMENLEKK